MASCTFCPVINTPDNMHWQYTVTSAMIINAYNIYRPYKHMLKYFSRDNSDALRYVTVPQRKLSDRCECVITRSVNTRHTITGQLHTCQLNNTSNKYKIAFQSQTDHPHTGYADRHDWARYYGSSSVEACAL